MNSIELIYFFYGLAFFSMGMATMLEAGRSPLVNESWALRFLAGFGFIHGFHEWIELYILKNMEIFASYPTALALVRLILLILSFTFLLVFSLLSLQPQRMTIRKILVGLVCIFLCFGLFLVVDYRLDTHNAGEALKHVDVIARYILGVVGAGLACAALLTQGKRAASLCRVDLARYLLIAAVGFGVYSLTQLVVAPQSFFPASVLNTTAFMALTGFPVQALRAGLAIIITISLIRSVQISDDIRNQELLTAQQARLEAMQQLQQEAEKRVQLRQEIMRHAVIAQEEERARIARELHDETSQVLTAFNLHLASLQQGIGHDCLDYQQVGRMKKLCAQMSDSLYRLVHDLRPAQLDDLGLVPALEFLTTENYRDSGIKVNLVINGTRRRLDSLVETVVFRITQEALLNVIRHAGVQFANIELTFGTRDVFLEINDQGRGFDLSQVFLPPRGFGLATMRERVEAVGGTFEIKAAPGEGTRVMARLPDKVGISEKVATGASLGRI